MVLCCMFIYCYTYKHFFQISKQVDNLLHIININNIIIVLSMVKLFLRVYQIILKPFNCVSVFNVDE